VTATTEIEKATEVTWFSQFEYEKAVALARKYKKPILLEFYSASCRGCVALQKNTLTDPGVIRRISQSVVPVRVNVESEAVNPITNALVGSHIFIWSQTVQLVSPDGDIYHKFLGAPRHTRLDMGYTRVHHDIAGHLPPADFLLQLELGLAKESLFEGNHDRAVAQLRRTIDAAPAGGLAQQEASYWLAVVEGGGLYPEAKQPLVTRTKEPLARAVERFCQALIEIPDGELMLDWHGKPNPADWSKYSDCLREIVFGCYQGTLDVAIESAHWREANGRPMTRAQRILRQHQVAYRELQGVLVGIRGPELDKIHLRENASLGKQRTVRNNFVHTVMAEWWAHAPQVRNTLRTVRGDATGASHSPQEVLDRWGEPPVNFGEMAAVFEQSETVHRTLVEEFASITDDELEARGRWWEDQPISIRFRLNRFGWHLHDHAAVIETILERVGRKRTETERLARLMYRALGEVEGALIGLTEREQKHLLGNLVQSMDERADEIQTLAEGLRAKGSN
jgi:hypothetical protein